MTKNNWAASREMFAMDRPYNQRLRAEMLYRKGLTVQVPTASSIDYSRLKEDLGAFYRILAGAFTVFPDPASFHREYFPAGIGISGPGRADKHLVG